MHNLINIDKYYTDEMAQAYKTPERSNTFSTRRAQYFKLNTLDTVKFEDSASIKVGSVLSGLDSVANCCGANFSVESSDYTYYLPSRRSELYCALIQMKSRGILIVGDHTDKDIVGTMKYRYSLGKYKFDVFLNTVDLSKWLHDLTKCTYDATPQQAIRAGYTYKEHDNKPVIDYTAPILSVYYAGTLLRHPELLPKILDTGCPIILIGAKSMSSWDGIRGITEKYSLQKYIVDYHEDIYNMNYLERRLNMIILYKDI